MHKLLIVVAVALIGTIIACGKPENELPLPLELQTMSQRPIVLKAVNYLDNNPEIVSAMMADALQAANPLMAEVDAADIRKQVYKNARWQFKEGEDENAIIATAITNGEFNQVGSESAKLDLQATIQFLLSQETDQKRISISLLRDSLRASAYITLNPDKYQYPNSPTETAQPEETPQTTNGEKTSP